MVPTLVALLAASVGFWVGWAVHRPTPPRIQPLGVVGTIPTVVGLPSTRAFTELRTVGLSFTGVFQRHGVTPRGIVVSQLPSPGSVVSPHSHVTLVVSAGPAPTCPIGEPTVHIRTEPHAPRFVPACVSVPANTALTLVFFNRITSLRGDRRVAENISIYRRESDAYSFSNGAYLFTGAKAHGLAVFVGQNVRWGR